MSRQRKTGFVILAALVAIVCVRLGFWQLERLEERRSLNALIEAQIAAPILSFQGNDTLDSLVPYQRVKLLGIFDPDHEFILTSRARNGLAGNHLVTPLLLGEDGPAILVDRGWIPIEFGDRDERSRYRIEDQVSVQGLVLPSQIPVRLSLDSSETGSPKIPDDTWRSVDIPGIQQQVPYELAKVYVIQSEPVETNEVQPIPELNIDLSEGPHLGYAVQWFAFAAVAIGGSVFWIYRKK